MRETRQGLTYVPFAGDEPVSSAPAVTLGLVFASVGWFAVVAVVTWMRGPDLPVRWFAALGLTPDSIRWHSPFTYWILHEHLLHLSANMLFLFVFGGPVEAAMGRARFAALFLASAAITGVVEAAASVGMARMSGNAGDIPMVIGSSGAAACVLGVFAARFYRARLRLSGTPISVPAAAVVGVMALGEMGSIARHALSATGPAYPSAAHWTHIAGFALGIGWAHLTGMVRAAEASYRRSDARRKIEEGSRFAAVRRWEAALASDPSDREAALRLIEALHECGEPDRAGDQAADLIASDLGSDRPTNAVAVYDRLRDLQPEARLKPDAAMALASALVEGGRVDDAVAIYDRIAANDSDERNRRTAQLRAATARLRRGSCAEDAIARLRAFLQTEEDDDWRAYAEKLLREAETSEAGRRP